MTKCEHPDDKKKVVLKKENGIYYYNTKCMACKKLLKEWSQK